MQNRKYELILCLAVFALYLNTACPNVYIGDNGELITAAHYLGIAHPPGYPLFSLAVKPWQLLPFGNIAFRSNVANAAFMSIALCFVFLIIQALVKSTRVAAISTLIISTFSSIWSNAVTAEVYAINALSIMAGLYFVMREIRAPRKPYILAGFFLMSIGIGNHYTAPMVLVVTIVALIIPFMGKGALRMNTLWIIVCLIMLGASLYLYLPLRSSAHPALNWGSPDTMTEFTEHVVRRQYGTLSKNPLSGSLLLSQLKEYLKSSLWQAFPWTLLSLLGLYKVIKTRNRAMTLLLVLYLVSSVGFMLILKYPTSPRGLAEIDPFFIPSYLIMGMFAAVGFNWLLRLVYRIKKRWIALSAVIIAILLNIYILINNYYKAHRQDNYIAFDYGRELLLHLPPGCVLHVEGDNAAFICAYMQMVNRMRQDVEILDINGYIFQGGYDFFLLPPAERLRIEAKLISQGHKPVFYIYPRSLDFIDGYQHLYHGATCRVVDSGYDLNGWYRALGEKKMVFGLRNLHDKRVYIDFIMKNLVANYLYLLAGYYANTGEEGKAAKAHLQAEEIVSDASLIGTIGAEQLGLGMVYAHLKQKSRAWQHLQLAIQRNPKLHLAYFIMGNIAYEQGELQLAQRLYEQVIEKNPKMTQALINLGNIHLDRKEYAKAIDYFKRAIRLDYHLMSAHFNLAVAYTQMGNYRAALDQYQVILNYDFNDANAHANLGNIYYITGDYDKAIKHWELSLNIDPRNINLMRNLSVLKREISRQKGGR